MIKKTYTIIQAGQVKIVDSMMMKNIRKKKSSYKSFLDDFLNYFFIAHLLTKVKW